MTGTAVGGALLLLMVAVLETLMAHLKLKAAVGTFGETDMMTISARLETSGR